MTNLFKRLFSDRSLYYKFNLAFLLVALIPISLLAYTSYRVIDNRLLKDAHEKIEIGLKTVWAEYYDRGVQMRYGMLQAASHEEFKRAIRLKDSRYLRETMEKWRGKRSYVDIWIIVDDEGNVLSRINSDLHGDKVEINDLVRDALSSGKSMMSTEIIPEEIINREGELHGQTAPLIDSKIIEERYDMEKGDEMALMVVTPVVDNYGTAGAIITADVINNDLHIPDAVSDRMPWLFTTISLDGLRISTNIKDKDGRNALWTYLPAELASKVGAGEKVSADWTLDREFVSVFDPIKDNKGRVIGSLDVAIMKSHLWDIQGENKRAIAAVATLGILLSLLVSLMITRRIVRPVKLLKEKALSFTKEEAQTTLPLPAHTIDDELGMMGIVFDNMMVELKKRNEERERHSIELEDKNKQLTELNDRLTGMNEKLEVSYEELQAQTEELNAANEELRVVNEEMSSKNAELMEANERVKEEKEEQKALMQRLAQAEKLSSIGELVSGVAHELNNPLTTIMGFSELLIEKECPADVAKKRLGMINESSHRCKHIIDNLLTFARSYKPEKNYSDLNRVISDTLELKEYQLRVSNIDVETDLAPSLPRTMLDEHQFQQVFLNLINNAHYSIVEKGKGGRISISTSFDGDTIRAKVSDTGKGMSDEIAKKIFDPFFTTKGVGEGTGLGLSISYGIIKEHGGNIYATGKPGEGATFVIELPIIEMAEESRPTSPAKSPTQLAAKGRRALALDDEPAILGILKEVLSNAGFHVDAANSGDEALEMLDETAYDLIISDVKMAGMDGKEFYKRLRTKRPEAARKIIFISGDTISQDTQNFLKETGNIFLKKPFTLEGLRTVISKHFANLIAIEE